MTFGSGFRECGCKGHLVAERIPREPNSCLRKNPHMHPKAQTVRSNRETAGHEPCVLSFPLVTEDSSELESSCLVFSCSCAFFCACSSNHSFGVSLIKKSLYFLQSSSCSANYNKTIARAHFRSHSCTPIATNPILRLRHFSN